MQSLESPDLQPVKSSDAEKRSQWDRQRRVLETELFTLETVGMRRFASSTRKALRATNACQFQRMAPCRRTESLMLQLHANSGSRLALKRAITRQPTIYKASAHLIHITSSREHTFH